MGASAAATVRVSIRHQMKQSRVLAPLSPARSRRCRARTVRVWVDGERERLKGSRTAPATSASASLVRRGSTVNSSAAGAGR